MKTKKLEKQTLTWLVFSANVIVGAMARQMVLHHGLEHSVRIHLSVPCGQGYSKGCTYRQSGLSHPNH